MGCVAFLLYAATGAHDIQWGDPAKLMLYVHSGVLSLNQEGHVGLILWSWPFSLLPIRPYALRLHFSSAMTLGAAIGLGEATLLGLGLSRPAARIGMAAVAVAHTVWFTGAMFESYPLVLLIIAGSAWLLIVLRKCVPAGGLLGLGMAVHPLAVFGLPGITYGLWKSPLGFPGVRRFLLGFVLGTLVPLLGLLWLKLPMASVEGINWASATGRYASLTNPMQNLPLLLGYAIYNFASPALLLLLVGVARLTTKERITALLFALPHYAIAAFWLPQRSYLIPIPVYFAIAYLIACGTEAVVGTRRLVNSATLALVMTLPVMVYAIAPRIVIRFGLTQMVRDAPYREEATYFLSPWKLSETSARDYITDLGRFLPAGSVVVGDWVLYTTVLAAQRVESWRKDVILIHADAQECDNVARRFASGHRVFVLDDEPGYLPDCIRRMGQLAQVPQVESLTELAQR